MKGFAIFLIVLVLCAAGGIGYVYITSNLLVTDMTCTATVASDDPEAFERLKSEILNGSSACTLFSDTVPDDAGEYKFYTYTVDLTNHSYLPADLIEIQIVPMSGDILQTEDLARHRLHAKTSGRISASILTGIEMHNVREIKLTWYFWGLPFQHRLTYSR